MKNEDLDSRTFLEQYSIPGQSAVCISIYSGTSDCCGVVWFGVSSLINGDAIPITEQYVKSLRLKE